MASAFKWRLTDELFSYLIDVSGDTPVINSGYPASKEEVISDKVIDRFANEQAYATQFNTMVSMINNNPDTRDVTLLNYSYYYDMDENSCGFINGGGIRGKEGEKGDKGDKGDTGARGPQGLQGVPGRGINQIVSTPLADGSGRNFYVILTDGTQQGPFLIKNGVVDYDVVNNMINSSVTINMNNYIEVISGDIRDLSYIVQTASSLTSVVAHQVCGMTTDISRIDQTCSSITKSVEQVSGEIRNVSVVAQTASSLSVDIRHDVCGLTKNFAKLELDYNHFKSQIGSVSGDFITYSEIVQVSTAITANVYDGLAKTGIDIRSGVIDINANTTNFHGSIKLFDADEGLMLFNDNNQVAIDIKNTSIGSFGTHQNSTVLYESRAGTYTYVIGSAVGSQNYRAYIGSYDTSYPNAWTSEINKGSNPLIFRLGRASNGTVFDFTNIKYTIVGDTNSGWDGNISHYKVKFQLYWLNSDHIVKDTGWITPTRNSSTGVYSIPNQSYTVTSAGSGYEWTVLMYLQGPNGVINGTQNKHMSFTANFTTVTTISINTKIGVDGMYSVSPNGEFWCSEDHIGMYFNNANNKLYGDTYSQYGLSVDAVGLNSMHGANITAMCKYPLGSIHRVLRVGSTYGTWNLTNYLKGKVYWGDYNNCAYSFIDGMGGPDHRSIPKPDVVIVDSVYVQNKPNALVLDSGYDDYGPSPVGRTVKIVNMTLNDNVYVVCRTYLCNLLNTAYSHYSYIINYDEDNSHHPGPRGWIKVTAGDILELMHIGDGYWLAMNSSDYRRWETN